MEKLNIGIRKAEFIKKLKAMSSAAGLCDFDLEKKELTVEYKENANLDNEMKTVMTLHPLHCGSACMLKLHVKNGRVLKITSAGDIPREGSFEEDESLLPIQRRACLKGFCEKRRIYAPDRLKYPLKQTLERGNIRGFKRISWDEALDTIADWYKEMIKRKDELGYLPVWDDGGITPYLGPHLKRYGNFSFGNLTAATFGAIGDISTLKGNPVMDIFNSKYIIVWANDHKATRPMLPFIMIKAKEEGIPITVIDTRYTDTAATMGTGLGKVPSSICVRPGTDAALLSAMANVIYRKNLHDVEFLKEYCFGFYPGESIVSKSKSRHPVTGESYYGRTFTVPEGLSFIEYLDELQRERGGYNGVLKWASELTGTPAAVIEELAIKYANTKPAFLYSSYNGGAQRTHNGMYFSWLLIAISAMTGNTNKRGGGFGEINLDDGYSVKIGKALGFEPPKPGGAILFSVFKDTDVILSGVDGRTKEQLREDVLAMNNIDLGQDAKLSVEMYIRGAGCSNLFNQVQNVNKRILAWKKLKHIVAYERFMTPTAAWSDIVLPTVTNFEESYFEKRLLSDTFVVNGPIDYMYDAKPDWWINEQIASRLGVEIKNGRKGLKDIEVMKKQWNEASIPEEYKEINPEIKLPSFEEMLEKGNFQLPVPKEKTFIHTASIKPGEFDTDTGRINFYSPYYDNRNRLELKVPRAQYVRPSEGYDDILENGGKLGAKGIKYTLQFITPHVQQRAHTTYDNVPVLKELCPHVVEIHPVDAESRGITDGDVVYAFNDYGCIKVSAMVTKRILPGVVSIGQGAWYRPSTTETYEAWFDVDNDGIAEKYIVPVDVGGCVNCITPDLNSGASDPFMGGLGMNAGGNLCEISKDKPQ